MRTRRDSVGEVTGIPEGLPRTLGELRDAGHRYRTVKEELRENLLTLMRSGERRFPGIVGFDTTVLPEVERAILAGHDMVLLCERGTFSVTLTVLPSLTRENVVST